MNALLSLFFGGAAVIVFFVSFVNLFIVHTWNFLPSLAVASLNAGVLFSVHVFFDRRDARLNRRPYRRILPSWMGFCSFLFLLYHAVALIGFIAAAVYGWLQIPAGDNWETAFIRLGYVFVVVSLGWLAYNAATGIAQRFFRGYVYDDWLDSFGTPISAAEARRKVTKEHTTVWLITYLVVSIAILFDALELLEPMLQWKGGGRRFKKYKWLLGWLLKHPNTVDLFAATTLMVSSCEMVWRLHYFIFDRILLGDDDEPMDISAETGIENSSRTETTD